MPRKTISGSLLAAAALALGAAALLFSSPLALAQSGSPLPKQADYESSPFMATGSVVPHVMIVMSKNIKMFQAAYPGLTDLDGDGRADTGFNPAVEYTGYFDSRSCYKYSGSEYKGLNSVFAYGDPNGYFIRAGDTHEDQSEAEIKSSRPASLKSYVVSPRSVTGICNDPTTAAASRTWSGNFLNYLATSRMDAIRRVLYGGDRVVDDATQTYLEGSFVPPDSTVWGSEVRSDDTWQEVTPLSAWFDVRKYTIYDKPASKKAHFFARGSDLGKTNKFFPAIRVLLNADKNSINIGGADSVGEKIYATEPYGRYFDWVLVNRPLPDDRVLTVAPRSTIKVYRVRVKACETGNIGEFEGCRRYPGTGGNVVYKPAGLLQKYGEDAQPMYFGLLTGGFNNNNNKKGGKLRSHIGPVAGPATANAYTPSVNPTTGQFHKGGLIHNISSLRIAGKSISGDPASSSTQFYDGSHLHSWYNPLGEMLFEALRYMGGETTPTQDFANSGQGDVDVESTSSVYSLNKDFYYAAGAWSKKRPSLPTTECFQPIILLISDITTDYDADQVANNSLNRVSLYPASPDPGAPSPGGLNLGRSFYLSDYLSAITKIENYDTSGSKTLYYFSENSTDSCSPKRLANGLGGVKGVCPGGMATEGSYSAAALSYYAHTHNFNLTEGGNPSGAEIYAVTMSSAFPDLVFPLRNSPDGSIVKSVSISPVNTGYYVQSNKQLMDILNYFVLEWDADSQGTTFHVRIKVNFSDRALGGDWEGDGQVTYDVSLLTDANSTPAGMRESNPATLESGDPAVRKLTLYKFKNPDSADTREDFITISASQVKAILITSSWANSGTGEGLALGYTITGTTRDGTYMDLTMNTPYANSWLTPPACDWTGGTTGGAKGCGKAVANIKQQSRVFAVRDSSAEYESIPSPMWLAAKYGGFKDNNKNGMPDPGEWEGDDGNPANYFQATNITELSGKLEAAFRTIARSLSSGTATSASVDTILGGGISIQTVFYPEYVSSSDTSRRVIWAGSVYGLFVDKWGNLREDSNGDHKLTQANGENGETGDYVVTFSSTTTKLAAPPACYEFGTFISRCYDKRGTNEISFFTNSEKGKPESIHRLKPIFDTGKWLSRLSSSAILAGPRAYRDAATEAQGRRRIYFSRKTSLDLFGATEALYPQLKGQLLFDNYADVLPGFTNKTLAEQALIQWVQGAEHPLLRSRTVPDPWEAGGADVVWRLGDVINSKPIIVGAPAAEFDLLYGDSSYTAFRGQYAGRRQMAYFGANDGMLHAINLGYYGSLAAGQVAFNIEPANKPETEPDPARHDLGAEVWAYIPEPLLPHLQWMASPNYTHAYYVDLKPLMTDVKIGSEWRTVLIGGLRLGGRPIEAADRASRVGTADEQVWYSEVFCLDVTDPEQEPKLLWRYSSPQAGLTVGQPAVVRNAEIVGSDGNEEKVGKFYAVIPSGPATDTIKEAGGVKSVQLGAKSPYAGYSSQKARLIVLDFATGKEVPDTPANYLTVEEENSFFNSPFLPVAQTRDNNWSNHALYFGLTVSRNAADCTDKGAVYRLQMAGTDGSPLPPKQWKLGRFYKTDRPVTGAVNSTYDSRGSLWVFFGTGRLWGHEDVTPCSSAPVKSVCDENHSQYIYGVKEALNPNGIMAFAERTSAALLDVSGAQVYENGTVTGLTASALVATGSGGATNFAAVKAAMAGDSAGGWKKKLETGKLWRPSESHSYEMIITQPKLLGLGNGRSLIAFTSFEPTTTGCGSSGYGYLHLLNAFTGLPDPATHDYFYAGSDPPVSSMPKNLVLGSVQMGTGVPSEAYIQVSSAGITVSGRDDKAGITDIHIPTGESSSNAVVSWKEVINMGFEMPAESISSGLGD